MLSQPIIKVNLLIIDAITKFIRIQLLINYYLYFILFAKKQRMLLCKNCVTHNASLSALELSQILWIKAIKSRLLVQFLFFYTILVKKVKECVDKGRGGGEN